MVTSCGPVEGLHEGDVYSFRGIPYAVPPTNDRRFKAAKPIEHIKDCWNGTLNAQDPSPNCWQLFANSSYGGTEDCLKLDNITPNVRYGNPMPVVVLIGADSLVNGSSNKLWPSARTVSQRNVVFVRPHFRIGVLGFMPLEELSKLERPPTSGNYGLTDILAALRWIQLNIHHFGGNPNSVTLLGQLAHYCIGIDHIAKSKQIVYQSLGFIWINCKIYILSLLIIDVCSFHPMIFFSFAFRFSQINHCLSMNEQMQKNIIQNAQCREMFHAYSHFRLKN